MEFEELLKAVSGLSDEQKTFVAKELGLAEVARQNKDLSEQVRKSRVEVARLRKEKGILEQVKKDLAEQARRLLAAEHASRRETEIERALSEGRILPKDREKWNRAFDDDPVFAVQVLSDLPKVIDYDVYGTSSEGPPEPLLSNADRRQAKQMGVSEEEYRRLAEKS